MGTFTLTLKEVLSYTPDIGLDSYPIFDESHRNVLNNKIVDHFLNREIGQETIDIFRHAVRRKMNEIMPLYNQMYRSEALILDPFLTFRSTSESATNGESESRATEQSVGTTKSATDSTARAVGSDTPQVQLSGNEDYATQIQDTVSRATADGSSDGSSTQDSTGSQSGTMSSSSEGFTGSVSALVQEYRATFLNIDMQIIDELEPLFMQIWDNGDSYTPGHDFFPLMRGFGLW
jgi:hypothetical protein